MQRRTAAAAASRVLGYPGEDLLAQIPQIRQVLRTVPQPIRSGIEDFLTETEGQELLDLQARYVSIFDMKRRCCLYLTYYLNGDTRRRGIALWRFQETYRRAGWRVEGGELPDYLPVLLEFAAVGGDAESAAFALLDEHRQGLEVLQAALEHFGSPHQHVIRTVRALLPDLTDEQREAAARLVASGPPTELVGIESIQIEPYQSIERTIGARV